MKMRKQRAMRIEPFSRSPHFNPWPLLLHSTDTITIHMERIGSITNQLRFANRNFDIQRDLGEMFLLNTRSRAQFPDEGSSIPEYFSSFMGPITAMSGTESVDSPERVLLPEPHALKLALSAVLEQRESIRQFSGDALEVEDLATILHACAGITHVSPATPIDGGPEYTIACHGVPSAGGLYAVDCFCYAMHIKQLKPGAYKYLSYEHSLARVHAEDSLEAMKTSLSASPSTGIDPDKIALALIFVGNPQKSVRKYGARGVRYLLLEAGMMAFAANLAAVALGFGTLDYQSFVDDQVEKSLGISLRSYYPLHVLLIGWPVESSRERTPTL